MLARVQENNVTPGMTFVGTISAGKFGQDFNRRRLPAADRFAGGSYLVE
jgi:hypothetical protein